MKTQTELQDYLFIDVNIIKHAYIEKMSSFKTKERSTNCIERLKIFFWKKGVDILASNNIWVSYAQDACCKNYACAACILAHAHWILYGLLHHEY
jgi:hypothetical protein